MQDGNVIGAGGGGMIEPGVSEIFAVYLDPMPPRRNRQSAA